MRSQFVVPICIVFTFFYLASSGAQSAPATPAFVTVAFNAAVLQTSEAQRDFNAMQAKFAPRQTHLQALNMQIEGLKKQLEDGASRLSDADREAKVRTLDGDEKQLQREAEDFKSDTDSASQQAFQATARKLYAFLREYAQKQRYSLVIDRGSDAAPAVWYAASQVDITDELVLAYNQRSGVAAPAKGTGQSLPSTPATTH